MTAVYIEEGLDKGAIWHFGEVAKEQRALAEGKAWADLSHRAVIAISGEDRLMWLHSLTTQHLEKLTPGIGKKRSSSILKDMWNNNSSLLMMA